MNICAVVKTLNDNAAGDESYRRVMLEREQSLVHDIIHRILIPIKC